MRVSVDHPTRDVATFPSSPPQALDAALALLAEGTIPVPLKPRSKVPYLAWTELRDRDSLPTEQEVRRWWERWPDAGLARVIPEGQAVVDIDPRNGGRDAFAQLDGPTRTLILSAPLVWSGRGDGGFHAWLSLPDGLTVKKGELAAGLDLLVPGGLEVLPPSRHDATGALYSWEGQYRPRPTLPATLIPRPPRRDPDGVLGSGRRGEGPPLRPELLTEWLSLWSGVGLELRSGERLYRCPWHDDTTASLSINRERGVFHCHAGCASGGVRHLRERLRVRVSLGGPKPLRAPSPSPLQKPKRNSRAVACPNAIPVAGLVGGAQLRTVLKPCEMRTCPVCGPCWAARHAAPVLATLAETGKTLYESTLDDATQGRALSARLRRAGAPLHKMCPAPGGRLRVFHLSPEEGAEVEDPQLALSEALAVAAQQKGRKVGGSRRWAATPAVEQGEPQDWETLGVVTASETWARRQAARIAGTPVVNHLDAHGRCEAWSVELDPEPATRAEQVERLRDALGIKTHAELARIRAERRAAAQVLVAALTEVAA